MGLNFCAGAGILFSLVATILIIFGEISQINDSTVPRHLRIVSVSTSGLGNAISTAAGAAGNASSIYYSGSGYTTKVNGTNDGLRQTYEWGFWNYCATQGDVGSDRSYCTERAFGFKFQPALALYQDVPTTYTTALTEAIPDGVFTADDYLGRYTQGANYLVFIGAILSVLAWIIGFFAHRFAFLIAAFMAIVGFLAIGVGLAMYTIMFQRAMAAINGVTISGVPLGLTITWGNALWISWAACAGLFLAILPYLIACCTGRNSAKDQYY